MITSKRTPIISNTMSFFVFVLLVSLCLFCSCASQPSSRNLDAQSPEKPKVIHVNQQNQTIEEDGKTYLLVSTPFGMVKSQEEAETPSQPDSSVPEKMTSKPPDTRGVVAKPSDKPIPSGNKILFNADKDSNRSSKGELTLNFDDADITEVIRTLAELLNINYILDPQVRGNITIHTTGKLDRRNLFPLFFQILEINGLTAVKEGGVYRITGLKNVGRLPISAYYGRDGQDLPPNQRIALQIIPLRNIAAEQMVKILTPFISTDGTIISHPETNTIMIVDKGVNILKALTLVDAFDIDLFSGIAHQFFKIKNTDVKDLIRPLTDVLSAYERGLNTDVKLIPIEHLSMILVLSQNPRVFERVSQIIETLDAANETIQPRIYIYSVKNGEAQELADLLKGVFGDSSKEDNPTEKNKSEGNEKEEKKTTSTNPFLKAPSPKEDTASNLRPLQRDNAGSGTLSGEIKITADKIRNALIIEAIPSDFKIVQGILERLDVLPRQVLIEAMIAEVTLDDSTEFGVEWKYVDGQGTPNSSLLSASIDGVSGLKYVVGETGRWSATLSALATENKVNILSSPSILASNDKESTINVSTEIPVASAEYQYTDASNQAVQTVNIEYRNTGIILKVKPHINENGLVSMEISQEVSERSSDVLVGNSTYPSFFQRSIETTLTAGHNQTIVIGGLIRENKTDTRSGVPGLSKIPLIGALFGKKTDSQSKNELILLITPRVIVSLGDIETITQEFKAKVSAVTRRY